MNNTPIINTQAHGTPPIKNLSVTATSQWEGPVPPPAVVKAFDDLVPGSAEKFVNAPFKETEHRHQIQNKIVDASISVAKRGQLFAAILGAVVLVGGMFLLYKGKNIQGFGTILIYGAFFIGVFIYGKQKEKPPVDNSKDASTNN